MSWASSLLVVAALAAEDPRIPIVEQQINSDRETVLLAVEDLLESQPERAKQFGLEYLRGRLLLELERDQDALQSFVDTLASNATLAPYGRYRIAIEQNRVGHPEVAAGLIATLLAKKPPRTLITPSARLLRQTIERGGDCRLLRGGARVGLRTRQRRQLDLATAHCQGRDQDPVAQRTSLINLLEEDRRDEVALLAARQLIDLSTEWDARTHLLIGLSFYNHREFDVAISHLARAQVKMSNAEDLSRISRREAFDCRYALARSHFWKERFVPAAAAYASLLPLATSPEQQGLLTYQRAKSIELAGDWPTAAGLFAAAFEADPTGRWADASLIATLRLHWLQGNEEQALDAYRRLVELKQLGIATRGLLFMASSDILKGRSDRADGWLAASARFGRANIPESNYWSGRNAELTGQAGTAVAAYVQAAAVNPFNPFSQASLRRLQLPALRQEAERLGIELASSKRLADLNAALLLLGPDHSEGTRARLAIEKILTDDPAIAPYLRLYPQPPEVWPLWQATPHGPEEMLLALGLFDEGGPAVLRHFPVSEPTLAFTGALELARAGDVKRSLYIAEILDKRIPDRAPVRFLSTAFRQLLFPFRYSFPISREAQRQEIDPFLLTAIIREESRFDPRAFSGASARGLTQFILPTARRIATKIGAGTIVPSDLEKPEVSIALGAAYLSELGERFGDSRVAVIAAYNAGEFQSDLWRKYCVSGEPEEMLTKIAFAETRAYVTRVLTSQKHYHDLYAPPSDVESQR